MHLPLDNYRGQRQLKGRKNFVETQLIGMPLHLRPMMFQRYRTPNGPRQMLSCPCVGFRSPKKEVMVQ